MSKLFLTPIDLNKNELQNPRMQNVSASPSAPVTGQFYYDTDDNKGYMWNGTTWLSMVEAGGSSFATPAVLLGSAAAAGVAATVIRSDATIAAFDATAPSTQAFGDSPAVGAVAFGARRDHLHGMPAHSLAIHQELIQTSDLTDWPRVAALSMNSQKITTLLDPTTAQDAATKAYVDAAVAGLTWKSSVRAATTVTGTLATAYENADVIDGVTLATGDRILIKDQSTGGENGVYVVNASGAPTRATDADSSAELGGMAVWVEEGTANGDTAWTLTTNEPITVGTTALNFAQFSGLGLITAGAGLTKTANTLDVIAGTGMVVNANDIAVLRTDTNGRVPLKYAVSFGDGASTSYTITHNLNSLDVIVQVYRVSDGVEVVCDATRATVNTVTLIFAVAPTSNQYRVVVYG